MSFLNLFKKDTLSPKERDFLEQARKNKKVLIDLNLQTQMMTKKDIGSWRRAYQMAVNVNYPNRKPLYDIYSDVLIDNHVTGCISQRKKFALKTGFKVVDKRGNKNEKLTEILEAEWFDDFLSLVLDSRYWGHSLIQFGDVVFKGGKLAFDGVELVPRKHVIPEFGVIVKNQSDNPRTGIDYRNSDLAKSCIEAGHSHNLGLLLKCAPQAISKKNMLAFWDAFGEIFGMPIRIAKTTSTSEEDRSKLADMLEQMGAAFFGVFNEGTEIDIKETARGDAFNVYDKRIERSNSEMSKCILNQTMTLDSGSSLSQSEVHLEVFETVIKEDQKFVKNIVNNKLFPFMQMWGFPIDGCTFEWDNAITYTPEQMTNVEGMILQNGYEIEPSYFKDKYGIPVMGKKKLETESFFE